MISRWQYAKKAQLKIINGHSRLFSICWLELGILAVHAPVVLAEESSGESVEEGIHTDHTARMVYCACHQKPTC